MIDTSSGQMIRFCGTYLDGGGEIEAVVIEHRGDMLDVQISMPGVPRIRRRIRPDQVLRNVGQDSVAEARRKYGMKPGCPCMEGSLCNHPQFAPMLAAWTAGRLDMVAMGRKNEE